MSLDLDLGLRGRTALVTGGTRGIGRAVVELLLDAGAHVVTVARDAELMEERLADWAEAAGRAGGSVEGLVGDVTCSEDRARWIARCRERFGALDLAVLNVGTNLRKWSTDYTDEEYASIVRTNQDAAFHLARALEPLLVRSRGELTPEASSLTFVLSVAGHVHVGTGAPYAMTKAALDQLTRSLACEWAPHVRVNAVSPWYTRTPLAEQVLQDPDYLHAVEDATPLGRVAEPHEVARPIAFLSSPSLASYVTGQTLAIDGGFLARGAF